MIQQQEREWWQKPRPSARRRRRGLGKEVEVEKRRGRSVVSKKKKKPSVTRLSLFHLFLFLSLVSYPLPPAAKRQSLWTRRQPPAWRRWAFCRCPSGPRWPASTSSSKSPKANAVVDDDVASVGRGAGVSQRPGASSLCLAGPTGEKTALWLLIREQGAGAMALERGERER